MLDFLHSIDTDGRHKALAGSLEARIRTMAATAILAGKETWDLDKKDGAYFQGKPQYMRRVIWPPDPRPERPQRSRCPLQLADTNAGMSHECAHHAVSLLLRPPQTPHALDARSYRL